MTDLVEKQIAEFIEKMRPIEELRHKLDLGYSYENHTVEIFEIRPQWDDESVIRHHAVAKARHIKSKNVWKIYWMPGSLKWTAYDPPEVSAIHEFLAIVEQDAHSCFFG